MSGGSGTAVWRMNRIITLSMYFAQESSRGGGSCQVAAAWLNGAGLLPPPMRGGMAESGDTLPGFDAVPLAEGKLGWGSGFDQRAAMQTQRTLRTKSCDCSTSSVCAPVCDSICYKQASIDVPSLVRRTGRHTFANLSNCSLKAHAMMSRDSFESSTSVSIACCVGRSLSTISIDNPELQGS